MILGILILMALCGIPVGSYLPERKEMDEDDQVKTELVEGSEEKT